MIERISNDFWAGVLTLLNVLLMSCIIWMAKCIATANGAIVFFVLYPVQISGNAAVCLVLKRSSPNLTKRWNTIILLMLGLFIPIAWLLK